MADPISIRFPDDLRAKLEARAKSERRSLSAQVIFFVEGALMDTPIVPLNAKSRPVVFRGPDPKPTTKPKPGRRA